MVTEVVPVTVTDNLSSHIFFCLLGYLLHFVPVHTFCLLLLFYTLLSSAFRLLLLPQPVSDDGVPCSSIPAI
jgi:hypothetical protein